VSSSSHDASSLFSDPGLHFNSDCALMIDPIYSSFILGQKKCGWKGRGALGAPAFGVGCTWHIFGAKPVWDQTSRCISFRGDRDSRHTVRLDENSHLVLFPSYSRFITSWAISPPGPWGHLEVDCRLVIMLVTPTPNGHRSTGSVWRPISSFTCGCGSAFSYGRWIGPLDLGFSLRARRV
jgi:hypothetical protein